MASSHWPKVWTYSLSIFFSDGETRIFGNWPTNGQKMSATPHQVLRCLLDDEVDGHALRTPVEIIHLDPVTVARMHLLQ